MPDELAIRNGKTAQNMNMVTGEVEITAGTQFEVPVQAYEGCILTWSFSTSGGDIGFGVTFAADETTTTSLGGQAGSATDGEDPQKGLVSFQPGEEIVLSENRRYHSDSVPVQGTVQIARGGLISLKWDNSYSFFKGKTLKYAVELEEPLGQRNGPRALGGPIIPQVVFVLGGPGVGKGTQCTRMAKEYGFVHLSAGDLLRAERNDPRSEHGQLITECIKEGKIVPVEITVALLWKAIRTSGRKFVLIDGFPRNRDNLEGWQRKVGGRAHVVCCLSFEAPDDVLVARLLERGKNSGREDDNPETIKKRLGTFHAETKPILEYFSSKGDLVMIDGNRPRDDVFADMCLKLKEKLQTTSLPSRDEFVLAAPSNRIAPRVILGTGTIGGEGMDEGQAKEYVREFASYDPGFDEVDTARFYSNGETEKILGNILVKSKSRVGSKVNAQRVGGQKLSPASLAAQIGETLAALRTESLDILYLQEPAPSVPMEKLLEACDALHRKGRFKELGLVGFPAWQVVNMYHVCLSRGWVRPTVYQTVYNVLARTVELELIPALRALGIRFYASAPLGGGMLTTHAARSHAPSHSRDLLEKASYAEALQKLLVSCEAFEISIQEASLRWLAHHSLLRTACDDGVITTTSKIDYLHQNLFSLRRAGPLPLPLVVAMNDAWEMCKADCPNYFS